MISVLLLTALAAPGDELLLSAFFSDSFQRFDATTGAWLGDYGPGWAAPSRPAPPGPFSSGIAIRPRGAAVSTRATPSRPRSESEPCGAKACASHLAQVADVPLAHPQRAI